jgi:hypothetical protein
MNSQASHQSLLFSLFFGRFCSSAVSPTGKTMHSYVSNAAGTVSRWFLTMLVWPCFHLRLVMFPSPNCRSVSLWLVPIPVIVRITSDLRSIVVVSLLFVVRRPRCWAISPRLSGTYNNVRSLH